MQYDKPATNGIRQEPARSTVLPLARARHPVLRLRNGQVDDPAGRLAVSRVLAPVRPYPAPPARGPAGAAGERAGVGSGTARVRSRSVGLVRAYCPRLWRP